MKTNTATLRIMMLEQPNKQGLWHYAIKEGLVLANLYPYDTFNYRVAYRTEITKKAISKEDFYNIEDILFDRVMQQHDDLNGGVDALHPVRHL